MEIEAEAIDSTKINRCEHCRRVQFAHPVPYGLEKCKLERIKDDPIPIVKILELRKKKKREEKRDFSSKGTSYIMQ